MNSPIRYLRRFVDVFAAMTLPLLAVIAVSLVTRGHLSLGAGTPPPSRSWAEVLVTDSNARPIAGCHLVYDDMGPESPVSVRKDGKTDANGILRMTSERHGRLFSVSFADKDGRPAESVGAIRSIRGKRRMTVVAPERVLESLNR